MIDIAIIVLAFQHMAWSFDPCSTALPTPTLTVETNKRGDMTYQTYVWGEYAIVVSDRNGQEYQDFYRNWIKLHEHPNLWNMRETDYIYPYIRPASCDVPILDYNLDNY